MILIIMGKIYMKLVIMQYIKHMDLILKNVYLKDSQ